MYAALERHQVAKRQIMKSFGSPDTYDLARGLALGGQSSSSSPALAEQSGGRVLPFLDPSASLAGEAFLFFPPPRWGSGLFLLLLVLVGGVRLGVIGHLKTRTLSSTRGLLLGLLLRHHMGCQNQQPRQMGIHWVFWQGGRTVRLLGLLQPVLSKEKGV